MSRSQLRRQFQESQSRQRYDQPFGQFARTTQLVDVEDSGTVIVSNVSAINFASNLSVTDDGDGSVTVDASSSGGFVADPAYDIENQNFTDQGMSDDFSDGSLDAQWTAVNLSAGTIDLFGSGGNIYQEDGKRETLFVQGAFDATTLDAGFRIDDWLSNGEEIITACSPGEVNATVNNAHHIGVVANDDDTGPFSGTFRQIYYDGSDNGNIKVFNGTSILNTGFDAGIHGRRIYFRLTRLSDVLYMLYSVNGASWVPMLEVDATLFNNFWLIFEKTGDGTFGGIGQFYWVRHAATNGEHDPFTA